MFERVKSAFNSSSFACTDDRTSKKCRRRCRYNYGSTSPADISVSARGRFASTPGGSWRLIYAALLLPARGDSMLRTSERQSEFGRTGKRVKYYGVSLGLLDRLVPVLPTRKFSDN